MEIQEIKSSKRPFVSLDKSILATTRNNLRIVDPREVESGPVSPQISPRKHWMGFSQQKPEERVSVDDSDAGTCGSYSPRPTLVLHEKPVRKHGSGVTYRSVMTSASAAISFRSLLVS